MAIDAQKLKEVVYGRVQEGELYEREEKNKVRCFACGHLCLIPEGHQGVCRVRYNQGGVLYVPWGYVAAFQVDPIEKKPFFHAHPGALATSFGMLGCDLHCSYCQNWVTSQALRDDEAVAPVHRTGPEFILEVSRRYGAKVVASTYNEPLITSEWAARIFKEAKAQGFTTAYISNGNGTPQVLDYLRPTCDLYKVDLKGFDDKRYRKLGGLLSSVCDTIGGLVERGFWVEIVTLLVPGFNDSDEEIRRLTRFLASVSRDIPWHVTAFHPDYKMTDRSWTQAEQLIRAAQIGEAEGLRFCYAGNLPGQVGKYENTCCPGCNALLVERHGFRVRLMRIEGGKCPECGLTVPGVW